jgi:hypothetical protein
MKKAYITISITVILIILAAIQLNMDNLIAALIMTPFIWVLTLIAFRQVQVYENRKARQ